MENLQFVIFMELIFGAILAYICYRAWLKINYAMATSRWKRAEGVIITSEVESYSTTDSDGNPDVGYRVKIEYQYRMGGSTFINEDISPVGHSVNSRRSAEKLSARYHLDKEVMVYVNPANPEQAYLEAGVTRRVINRYAIPAAFIVTFMILLPIFAYIGS